MANGDTKTESYLRAAAEGTRADLPSDTCCNTKTQNLILGVANRIMDVEDEVEELKNNPDVVDIIDTYADLQAYDTSSLTDKDIIRVLSDETHDDNSTYYRWNAATQSFDFVGEISGGGSSVNVVQSMGTSTTDVMSQDATTKMITSSPNQTSVNILSNTSYGLYSIAIGNNAVAYQARSIAIGGGGSTSNAARVDNIGDIAIGSNSKAGGYDSIAIGENTNANEESVALGHDAGAGSFLTSREAKENVYLGHQAGSVSHSNNNSVALGHYSQITRNGEVSVGTTTGTSGYNNTGYRVIGNVYDPQLDHDAANKEYVDNSVTTFVNLSLVSMTSTTITVTPDKTIAEVNDLVNAGKHVVLKLVEEQDVGSFLAGTYFFNLVFVNSSGIIANTVQYATGNSFEYQQISPATNGTITIRPL